MEGCVFILQESHLGGRDQSLPTPVAVESITSSPWPWSELSEETAGSFSSTRAALVF